MIYKQDASKLHSLGLYYTSTSDGVTNAILNPYAMCIWIYLISQKNTYVVRAKTIQDRFDMSERKFADAMKYLKKMDLVRYKLIRDKNGKVVDNIIEVSGIPFAMIDDVGDPVKAFYAAQNKGVADTALFPVSAVTETPKSAAVNKELISLSTREEEKQEPKEPTLAEKVVEMLNRKLITGTPTPDDPKLLAYLEAGLTFEDIVASASWCALNKKNSFGYVMKRATERRKEAANIKPLPAKPDQSGSKPAKPAKPAPTHASHIEAPSEPLKRAKAPPAALAMLEEHKKILGKSIF